MDQLEQSKAEKAKLQLSAISPSFCTVKWKHATLNLSAGAVKSCCHLPFQKVEMDRNHAQLHETELDKKERKQMLQGEKPKNCSYCWWIEEQGNLSDRIVWSSKSWMAPYTEEASKTGSYAVEAKTPSWVELNFSNVCNLKCSYCSPIYSTKWLQEIREHGPYPTSTVHNDLSHLSGVEFNEKYDNSELMTKFWPWFENAYPNLRLLKVTGGEPLLSPHTLKVLDWVLNNSNSALNLSINSNLTVPENNWQAFISRVAQIKRQTAVRRFYLHPSIDSYGARAEYIRHGLNFQTFQKHVEDYLENSGGDLVFICTMNNLALAGLKDLWSYILDLKKKYAKRGQWISMTTEILYSPEWQNINILPPSFQIYVQETIDYARANSGIEADQFSSFEIMGLERVLDMMKQPPPQLREARANFYQFFSEHDRRRGTDLVQTFPEMKEFWELCRRCAEGNVKVNKVKYMIMAQDMKRAVEFYSQTFGMKISFETEMWTELFWEGSTVALHGGHDGQPHKTGLSFQVKDIFQACEEAKSAGATIVFGPDNREGENLILAGLRDPEGNEIMFTQYNG